MTEKMSYDISLVLATVFLIMSSASCGHTAGTSAMILDENLAVVNTVSGPYSIAVTSMPEESVFAVLSARGLVQVVRRDVASVEQRWRIPSREKFDSFSIDGRFTVTTSGDEVIWRSTTDGDIAGQIGLAQPHSASIGFKTGVVLSSGQVWTFQLDASEPATARVRTAGALVGISGDEQVVSVGEPEVIPFKRYGLYSMAGPQLASFSDVRAAAWIDDVTFAVLGSQRYCEWSRSEGTVCLWDKELEYDRISADVKPESVLLWSRFSRVLKRYSRSDGHELEGSMVSRHLNISSITQVGGQIVMSVDQSVTWRDP